MTRTKRHPGGLTVFVVPEGGRETRSIRVTAATYRIALLLSMLFLLSVAAMAGSWWYMALQARKSEQLQATVDSLQQEQIQISALADELAKVEIEYERLRALFGPSSSPMFSEVWLPPSGVPGSGIAGRRPAADDYLPRSWPLTEAGFVTQPLIEGEAGDHPGLDIAVPTHSYVRASGAGRALRIGDDPVYGLFVVLEHGEGYQTVYAHTSLILVERGQSVRRNEVIALTGSSGRSTAPHLHFEILLDGIPVDPVSMVQQPT